MTPKERVKAIVFGIKQDLNDYDALQQLLSEQRTLLQSRNCAGLEEHNQKQLQLCQQLKRSAHERAQHLSALGLEPNGVGFKVLMSKLPTATSDKVSTLWSQLEQKVTLCKHHNDGNGQLLSTQQQSLAKLLNPEHTEALNNDYGLMRS